jgi:hypothetical protein
MNRFSTTLERSEDLMRATRPLKPCAHPDCLRTGNWLVEDRGGGGRYVCETHIAWGANPHPLPRRAT